MLQRRRHAQAANMCEKSQHRLVQHDEAGIETRPACKLWGQAGKALIEQPMETPFRCRRHLRKRKSSRLDPLSEFCAVEVPAVDEPAETRRRAIGYESRIVADCPPFGPDGCLKIGKGLEQRSKDVRDGTEGNRWLAA